MKGSAHYRIAENLLSTWEDEYAKAGAEKNMTKMVVLEEMQAGVMAAAQVHATLALTMATMVGMEAGDWE